MDRMTAGVEYVKSLVSPLVEHPDDLIVTGAIDELGTLITIEPHNDDLGRVIGRKGVNAEAIRTLTRTYGAKQDARFNVKVIKHG